MKPRFQYAHGAWRVCIPGSRVAGFGRTPQQAWEEYLRECWIALRLPMEGMGS